MLRLDRAGALGQVWKSSSGGKFFFIMPEDDDLDSIRNKIVST